MTKIVSWNVNGLRAVMKKGFAGIVKSLDADILLIQETQIHGLILIMQYQHAITSHPWPPGKWRMQGGQERRVRCISHTGQRGATQPTQQVAL